MTKDPTPEHDLPEEIPEAGDPSSDDPETENFVAEALEALEARVDVSRITRTGPLQLEVEVEGQWTLRVSLDRVWRMMTAASARPRVRPGRIDARRLATGSSNRGT